MGDCSGLDDDLDQCVSTPHFYNLMINFTPYLKYQIAENAKPCKKLRPNICLTYLKKSCLYWIHVAFLGKLPRFIQLVYIKVFSY